MKIPARITASSLPRLCGSRNRRAAGAICPLPDAAACALRRLRERPTPPSHAHRTEAGPGALSKPNARAAAHDDVPRTQLCRAKEFFSSEKGLRDAQGERTTACGQSEHNAPSSQGAASWARRIAILFRTRVKARALAACVFSSFPRNGGQSSPVVRGYSWEVKLATGTITDKINNIVALLVVQCNCGTPSEIKSAFQELQAALNAQSTAVTAFIATLP